MRECIKRLHSSLLHSLSFSHPHCVPFSSRLLLSSPHHASFCPAHLRYKHSAIPPSVASSRFRAAGKRHAHGPLLIYAPAPFHATLSIVSAPPLPRARNDTTSSMCTPGTPLPLPNVRLYAHVMATEPQHGPPLTQPHLPTHLLYHVTTAEDDVPHCPCRHQYSCTSQQQW